MCVMQIANEGQSRRVESRMLRSSAKLDMLDQSAPSGCHSCCAVARPYALAQLGLKRTASWFNL